MTTKAGLDFETSCELDLKVVGIARYVAHPSFRVLCGALYYASGAPSEFDFLTGRAPLAQRIEALGEEIKKLEIIVAHNVTFERLVLAHLGIDTSHVTFIDSAVISRCVGAESKLEYAAPQLLPLGSHKLETGAALIKKFCHGENLDVSLWVNQDWSDWQEFLKYCRIDAKLSLHIYMTWGGHVKHREHEYEALTNEMNLLGWHVDLDTVRLMKAVSEQNKLLELARFERRHGYGLNFNSPKQLQEWCRARGVRIKSFTEDRTLVNITKLNDRIENVGTSHARYFDYVAVRDMLKTKILLGGSSLKKLDVILNTISDDGRLRHQYMHAGAGQTYRTTGKGVQMQNLKRLKDRKDISDLHRFHDWSNTELAQNLRQVFCASDPQGKIIVSDFSAVESRGLAYIAGADWKLDAYRQGQDIYKVGAVKMARMFWGIDLAYEDVTKDQRAMGKLGELACGYQAGGPAVGKFAAKSGTYLTDEQASQVKDSWRQGNPEVVQLWVTLDAALHQAVRGFNVTKKLAHGLVLRIENIAVPESLTAIHPGTKSLSIQLGYGVSRLVGRVIHGTHLVNDSIHYYKPTSAGTQLWVREYTLREPGEEPVKVPFTIYGGKLAGILTQSFCREIFFERMQAIMDKIREIPNLSVVGQFHDELVFEWLPSQEGGAYTLSRAEELIQSMMEDARAWPDFPLAAATGVDYRYVK